ncbi:MAG: hypothetical protein ACLRRT_10805 [Ruthenibacterium lactatiformans]
MHGEEDAFVPTWMGRALYEACAAPKQLWLVPGARHAMSYAVAHKEYVRRLCAFLARAALARRAGIAPRRQRKGARPL